MNHHVFVPLTLANIHKGLTGITKCQQMARDIVYWPWTNGDIEDYVKRYQVCLKAKFYLHIGNLLHHLVFHSPLQKAGVDVYEWNKNHWLLVSKYFGKYPFLL